MLHWNRLKTIKSVSGILLINFTFVHLEMKYKGNFETGLTYERLKRRKM